MGLSALNVRLNVWFSVYDKYCHLNIRVLVGEETGSWEHYAIPWNTDNWSAPMLGRKWAETSLKKILKSENEFHKAIRANWKTMKNSRENAKKAKKLQPETAGFD